MEQILKRRFGTRRASESRYQKRDVSVLVTLNIAEVCASFLSAQALGCDLRTAETRCGAWRWCYTISTYVDIWMLIGGADRPASGRVPRDPMNRTPRVTVVPLEDAGITPDPARRQLFLPVGDNYFCRRKVSKGVLPTTWQRSVVVVGRSVAVKRSAGAPTGA